MSQCTLLYPGLLGPSLPLQELAPADWPQLASLPGLSLCFGRARRQAIARRSYEYHLLSHLGYHLRVDAELPVALLRTQTDSGDKTARLWCLDPVYVQLDREMAYLTDPHTLKLSETEARELIASLNAHFSDVMRVRFHAPQEWLVRIDLEVQTTTPSQAIQQDVNRMQPVGRDARRWRQLLNEIQMLLHSHPVNEARLAMGKPPANSVWLWGGGDLATGTTGIDLIYSDEHLAAAAALRNAVAFREVPDMLAMEEVANENSLMLLTAQLDAIRYKDAYSWLSALQELDQRYISPLLKLLRQGALSSVVLCSDTVQFSLDKSCLTQWWRGIRKPAKAILRLREEYGC